MRRLVLILIILISLLIAFLTLLIYYTQDVTYEEKFSESITYDSIEIKTMQNSYWTSGKSVINTTSPVVIQSIKIKKPYMS